MENLYLALGSVVSAIVVIVAIVCLRAFLKSEFWAKNAAKFLMFRAFVEAAIIQVADAVNSGTDMTAYEAKAELWAKPVKDGGKGINLDFRMWAVLDKIETNPLFSGFLEFDTVVTLVEAWYQMLRKSDNGLVLNPAKDIVSIDSGVGFEDTLEIGLTDEQARILNQ